MAKYYHFIYSFLFHLLFLKSRPFKFVQLSLVVSSVQSLNLESRWDTTDDIATLLHLCLPLPSVNIQPLVCPQFVLAPFTILCRIVFDMKDNLAMWSYHLRFRIFIMARRSLCTPTESWNLLRTSSFITWSL